VTTLTKFFAGFSAVDRVTVKEQFGGQLVNDLLYGAWRHHLAVTLPEELLT